MREKSIMLLRVSVGILMIFWGLDKIVNVGHAVKVSDSFYLGLFSQPMIQHVFGVLEVLLGIGVTIGYARKFLYPPLIVANGISALSTWKSIVDPWGWYLEGSYVLLHPTLMIFFVCLVLWEFREDDTISFDAKKK